jgi:hypothetical protein
MKRRPHGELKPVYVRLPLQLWDEIDRARCEHANAEGQFVGIGETCLRLIREALEQRQANRRRR